MPRHIGIQNGMTMMHPGTGMISKMQAHNQMFLGGGMGMYPSQMMYPPFMQGSSASKYYQNTPFGYYGYAQ